MYGTNSDQTFLLLAASLPKFQLISWCGNFAKRRSFRRVSGGSPKTLLKLCIRSKYPYQKIRWNFGNSHSECGRGKSFCHQSKNLQKSGEMKTSSYIRSGKQQRRRKLFKLTRFCLYVMFLLPRYKRKVYM